MSNFPLMYPHCAELGLRVIDDGPGYDELELEQKLGPERFRALMKSVSRVFCCNHRKYEETAPDSHRIKGYERHCIYAEDLEAFLTAGG